MTPRVTHTHNKRSSLQRTLVFGWLWCLQRFPFCFVLQGIKGSHPFQLMFQSQSHPWHIRSVGQPIFGFFVSQFFLRKPRSRIRLLPSEESEAYSTHARERDNRTQSPSRVWFSVLHEHNKIVGIGWNMTCMGKLDSKLQCMYCLCSRQRVRHSMSTLITHLQA